MITAITHDFLRDTACNIYRKTITVNLIDNSRSFHCVSTQKAVERLEPEEFEAKLKEATEDKCYELSTKTMNNGTEYWAFTYFGT